MQYRHDIQGLRGIAVLGVCLFHLGVTGVSGGYVGVDIFFVISGFLITGIIAQDISAGRFSFVQFYNRRMKRILPAFQLVGMLTLLAGWFLMLPTSLLVLTKSLIASSLYASNIYFWRETTGYFGTASDELPLLHNWSLSVEEQFYLIWPLTLVLLLRCVRSKHVPFVVGVIIVGSFALAEWGAGFKATGAYFLLPTRAGEFLLGALLVFLPEGHWRGKPIVAQSQALLGLMLILAPNVLLNAYSRFPGLNAFWPCLGTAMVIDSGRRDGTVVKALLSFKPLVHVGTISYSLYLWHWPPVAFLHYFDIEITGVQKVGLFCGVLLLASLSWRFVEETLRKLDWHFSRTVLVFAVLPLLVQAGAYVFITSEKPAFHGLAEEISSPDACRELRGTNFPASCRIGDQARNPTFALWGDSFADTLWAAIDTVAKQDQVSGYRFIMHMCPSITGTIWDDPQRIPAADFPQSCRDFNTRTLDYVLQTPEIHTVILTSSYLWYLDATNAEGKPILAATRQGSSVADAFRDMLERLTAAHKRVIVVMPHPGDKDQFNAALRRAYVLGTTASLYLPGPKVPPDALTAMIESLPSGMNIDRVYPHLMMCDANKCRVFDDSGDLYLSDGAHVTGKTASAIVARFPPGWDRPQQNTEMSP